MLLFNLIVLALNILFAYKSFENYVKYNNNIDLFIGLLNVLGAVVGIFNIAIRL